ncbi:hypothetical protein B1748_07290 [Paenibacillus sp. MY03]|jgi:hypothetical protein|uniref:Radical SAM protein n=1 Tax=Paenibacillus agaridevorans TaxID=171404 RepID=A0A2R5F5V6_9BACL|nr:MULTISPECIES: hypothetical protein [Paenibacillus]OUS77592.1 hypothetical protein B1748_07290 [Paenibacillus sp. MY03]GBG12263.1 hypothetical protein PAT3040_07133 [Paenibacillus agaridevorans]
MDIFQWNDRLRLHIPTLAKDWEQYSLEERTAIIARWELIRGTIPDRVMEFEAGIIRMQAEMDEEDNFERCCELTYAIADLASRINDLHIWYRNDQDVESRRHS